MSAYTKYLPKRVDATHARFVSLFRRLGFSVQSVHEVGQGAFDLVIAKQGLNIWVEVKDGAKSPSARKLTDPQKKWHFSWQGMRCVVTTDRECMMLAEQVGAILQAVKACGVKLEVTGSTEKQYEPTFYA